MSSVKAALPLKWKIPIVSFFFLFLWVIFHLDALPYQGRVIVTAATNSPHMMQVFWATSEHQYSPTMSTSGQLYPGEHEYHRTFLPAGMLRKVRIDPVAQTGADITIHRVQVALDAEVIFDVSGRDMIGAISGLQQLKTVPGSTGKGFALVSTGSDPYFELDITDAARSHWRKREAANGLLALCIAFLFWVFLHYVTTERYLERSHDTYPQTRMHWFYWGCIFLASGFFFVPVIPVQLHEKWWVLHWISSAYVIGVILFVPIFLLQTREMVNAVRQIPFRFNWLWFALPSIIVWFFYLAAFWPGSMSPDSFDQWRQLLNGHLKDWHPAFHTMTLWLITRIYLSPALVAAVQILTLASVIGWVLSVFLQYGVSRKILWCTSILCALWPVNGLMVVTLWKDVAYSIVLLVLAVYILQIVMEKGQWLVSTKNLFLLGLILILVSLYRHNGIIPAFMTPIMLMVFYPRRWKVLLLILMVTIMLHGVIKGPIYRMLDVKLGSPMTRVIQRFQKDFFVVKNPPVVSKTLSVESEAENMKHPERGGGKSSAMIILERVYSASALWRVKPMEFFHKRIEHVNLWREQNPGAGEAGEIRYVVGNKYGIKEQSLLPNTTAWLYEVFQLSENNAMLYWMWRPAVYLYTMTALLVVLSFRIRKKMFLLLFPALVNSLPLFLVVIHKSIFRYHYPIVLLGIVLFLPLLFLKDVEFNPLSATPQVSS